LTQPVTFAGQKTLNLTAGLAKGCRDASNRALPVAPQLEM
jgi:hypothetical protein